MTMTRPGDLNATRSFLQPFIIIPPSLHVLPTCRPSDSRLTYTELGVRHQKAPTPLRNPTATCNTQSENHFTTQVHHDRLPLGPGIATRMRTSGSSSPCPGPALLCRPFRTKRVFACRTVHVRGIMIHPSSRTRPATSLLSGCCTGIAGHPSAARQCSWMPMGNFIEQEECTFGGVWSHLFLQSARLVLSAVRRRSLSPSALRSSASSPLW